MSAHAAVPHTMPGRVLADMWRASWPTIAALPVGFDIVIGGLLLQQAGYQGWAMLLMYGSLLLAMAFVAWFLAGKQSPDKPVPRLSCQSCGRFVTRLSVTVYGRPRADVVTIVHSSGINVCGDCAGPVIDRAMRESDWSLPAVVVIPIRQVS